MSAPALSARTRQRLAACGVTGQTLGAFLEWARRAGYLDLGRALDGYSDRDLQARVFEFANGADRAAGMAPVGATLAWPGSPSRPPLAPLASAADPDTLAIIRRELLR